MKLLIKKLLTLIGYKISNISSSVDLSSKEILEGIFDKKAKLTIFDIGAHNGESAKIYRKIFKNSEIYSFEPYPKAYKKLKELNIKNFKSFNFGFSNKKSIDKFLINFKSSTNSLLEFSKEANNIWGKEFLNNSDKISCNFDTIDNFCRSQSLDFIDFMKIDVQGAEYLVLDGAKEYLLNKKIKVLQLEIILGNTYVGQKSIGFYISLLESYGYKFRNFSDSVVRNGKLIQTDLFFTI